MKNRRLAIVLIVLGCCYVAGPYLAGTFRVGDRLGPVVYPEGLHEVLYIVAHEDSHNEKPRLPSDSWMYNRPVFYGFPRRLKPEHERKTYLDKARQNQSPQLEKLVKMNEAKGE
jgi:hypothetical protein